MIVKVKNDCLDGSFSLPFSFVAMASSIPRLVSRGFTDWLAENPTPEYTEWLSNKTADELDDGIKMTYTEATKFVEAKTRPLRAQLEKEEKERLAREKRVEEMIQEWWEEMENAGPTTS